MSPLAPTPPPLFTSDSSHPSPTINTTLPQVLFPSPAHLIPFFLLTYNSPSPPLTPIPACLLTRLQLRQFLPPRFRHFLLLRFRPDRSTFDIREYDAAQLDKFPSPPLFHPGVGGLGHVDGSTRRRRLDASLN
ncbi:hypothetical protein M426DRAFT_325517 [Hypoxylon sp. CI-4A]|nr:hypothetical protein M426DRAFT_325517 [Hypoxylon sp. CI-4A]